MKISGKITDLNGLPLSGATIKKIIGENSYKVGTIANNDGKFSLEDSSAKDNDEFLITYIGFTPQRFYASELLNKTIKMVQKDTQIEPVDIVVNTKPKKSQEKLTNNFKLHFQKHKMLYAGIGGLLGLALIFTSIKKR